MREEAQTILDQAFALLEKARREREAKMPPREPDALERWRAKATARQAAKPEPQGALDTIPQAWVDLIDQKIAAALKAERRLLLDVVGCALANERQRQREELAKLRQAMELRIDGLVHALAKQQRGLVVPGEVIDLPALPRRRH
jgi:hypothetical protein